MTISEQFPYSSGLVSAGTERVMSQTWVVLVCVGGISLTYVFGCYSRAGITDYAHRAYRPIISAATESSTRFVVVLLLRHRLAAEFSEDRDRLFAVSVEPIDTYAVAGVGVFHYVEYIGRSDVMKFHSQRVRREDVVGDVPTPLSGDVFICGCVSR